MPKLMRGVIHDARAHERHGMRLSMLVCAEPYPQMQAVSRGVLRYVTAELCTRIWIAYIHAHICGIERRSAAARDRRVVYAHMATHIFRQ